MAIRFICTAGENICLKGRFPFYAVVIRGIGGEISKGKNKRLLERNKHCSKVSKWHSSDSTWASFLPLNIKS